MHQSVGENKCALRLVCDVANISVHSFHPFRLKVVQVIISGMWFKKFADFIQILLFQVGERL